jgi:alpha-1,6-mannosyltransferase
VLNRPATATLPLVAGVAGSVGALFIAVSSWWVGATPASMRGSAPAGFALGSAPPRTVYYVGLVLLLTAWLALGVHLWGSHQPIADRTMIVVAIAWALPLFAALPIGSRDVWAYAAQGDLDRHGLDPYVATPSDRPGPFLDNVSARWVDTPAPYGPFWLTLSRLAAFAGSGHVELTTFLLRVPIMVGFALLLVAARRLPARAGARSDRAIWLAVLNPITVILGVGGSHNDVLMVGLMALAAAIAARASPSYVGLAGAAALVAIATAVKSPAAIGVAFVVPLWLAQYPAPPRGDRLRPAARAIAVTLASAGATFAVLTLIEGHGIGWLRQVDSSASVVTWMSLPTAAAIVVKLVSGQVDGARTLDDAMRTWRTVGLILAAAGSAALWLASLQRTLTRTTEESHRRTVRVLAAMAGTTVVVILLSPAVQPWYAIWALPFVAAAGVSGAGAATVVAVAFAMTLLVHPQGTNVQMTNGAIAPLAIAIVVAAGFAVAIARQKVPPNRFRRRS